MRNEDLADALFNASQELVVHDHRWLPDLLFLLLEISDDPIKKTDVEALRSSNVIQERKPLTWADITKDDPLDDAEGLWDSVNYGEESSVNDDDEDYDIRSYSEPSEPSPETSFHDEEDEEPDNLHHCGPQVLPDFELAREVQATRTLYSELTKIKDIPKDPVPESFLMRETLFMLHGLETDVYGEDDAGNVYVKARLCIRDVDEETLRHMLEEFTSLGKPLLFIKRWVNRRQNLPLVQRLQASLASRLKDVDDTLSSIECDIIRGSSEPTTLLSMLTSIKAASRCLLLLTEILRKHENRSEMESFTILESLYHAVCLTQGIGDDSGYEYIGKIFFECFAIYTRPILAWMEIGQIDASDVLFFIRSSDKNVPLGALWSDQYQLVHDQSGHLHAPKFLHPAAKRIFTTGKSVNMLRAIGQPPSNFSASDSATLTWESVCGSTENRRLGDFNEAFTAKFGSWIANKHRSSSHILRGVLSTRCGLWKSLDALEYIYFARNGSIGGQIANSIFDRIDKSQRTWNDCFILKDLYQELLGPLPCIDADRISVRVTENQRTAKSNLRSIHKLDSISVAYGFPWAVATIIKPSSIPVYQQVSVMLLQLRRARQVLDIHLLKILGLHERKDTERNTLILHLRHRLRWFVDTIHTYLTTTIISPSTTTMRSKLDQAEDLDEMITIHEHYILTLSSRCLLAPRFSSTHQAIISLLDLTILFSDAITSAIPTNGKLKVQRRRRQLSSTTTGQEDDGSEEDDAEAANAKPSSETGRDGLLNKLKGISTTYSRLLGFVLAGVREASRTTGEQYVEALVDNLAFSAEYSPSQGPQKNKSK